jgi:hypothetical protein
MGAVVQAAGSATIRDDAGLFTSAGRSAIERAAEQNNVRVVVITNNQSFPSKTAWKSAWRAWLRSQVTDPNAITIGLHAVPGQKYVYVVPGAKTGISQDQANQGVRDSLPTFNHPGPAEGVIRLIQDYHRMGATAPGGSAALARSEVVLSWRKVPGAARYYLQFWLVKAAPGQTITLDSDVNIATQTAGPRATLDDAAMPAGTYQWRTAAVNAHGSVISRWTPPQTVTLN